MVNGPRPCLYRTDHQAPAPLPFYTPLPRPLHLGILLEVQVLVVGHEMPHQGLGARLTGHPRAQGEGNLGAAHAMLHDTPRLEKREGEEGREGGLLICRVGRGRIYTVYVYILIRRYVSYLGFHIRVWAWGVRGAYVETCGKRFKTDGWAV